MAPMKESVQSLRSRIAKAKTPKEIEELLAEGAKYQWASDQTRRRWLRASKRIK